MIELGYNYLHWFKRHYFLYIFGFLIYFKPIEPFYREMVISTKNITEREFDEDILPLAAYSTVIFALLIFFFLIFTYFTHVFILTLIGSLTYTISSWKGEVVTDLQVSQVFYGAVVSSEIMYFASIYVCHGTGKNFAKLTSSIRAVPLCAKVVSAVLAYVLTQVALLDYQELVFLSVPSVVHALPCV
ncbi:thiamine transporter 2-like isoform X3 [Tribolium madens]|uniref:thiamine transporter 2-like isoform X3 n=1 Tax=Tribolium madens TaxID=41895 RepID=UPI001CF736CB|nr:thiamine transporter 2-like isoform X3 [Tribolium madens]